MSIPKMRKIARWESKSGKHWVDLLHDGTFAAYTAPNCGGYLGTMTPNAAISAMQQRVDTGYYQPDANKTPMKKV